MKSETQSAALKDASVDVLLVPVFDTDTPASGALAELDAASGGTIASLVESGELKGRRDEVVYLHGLGGVTSPRVAIVGMGPRAGDGLAQARRAISVGVRHMRGKRHAHVGIADTFDSEASLWGEAAAQAAAVASVDLSLYKTEDRNDLAVERVTILAGEGREDAVRRGAERGALVAESMNFARLLGNEPGNYMTPSILADRTSEMAAEVGLECEVLDEDRMRELGMGALLGVSQGSEEPARLIVLRHEPEGADESDVLTFVGKGLTFDSGGISIKPREGMEWMKYDMCGGAAVVGAMQAVARLAPARRVMGVVASSENMPSGKAFKPGDVLRSYLGKTIEVLNTDAEGRLILADALAYAIEKGATRIVDLATLTGACVIALGHVYAAVMGNDEPWVRDVLGAAGRAGEKLWELPMDRAYREQIRSDIADIKNLGGRTAGTITAGYFLREFVGKTPWAHMDIAGTAWVEEDRPDIARGATGYGIPTLVELAAPAAAVAR